MATNGSSHPKLPSLYFLWLNTSTMICLTDTAASIKHKPTALYTSMTLLQELESIPLVGLLDAHRSFLTYPFLPNGDATHNTNYSGLIRLTSMFTVAQQRLRSGPKIFQPPANSSPRIYIVTLITGGGGEPSEHPPPSVYVSLQDANGKGLETATGRGSRRWVL